MIELKEIDVQFIQKKQTITAVKEVSLTIETGDIFGIVGYSGAGKSTLVRVINLLQRPTAGSVKIKGVDLLSLSPKELRQERRKIGMIFQHFNLMNNRTIAENVAYSLKYTKISKEERQKKIAELLALVGLTDKSRAYPNQLSGGQKQRVAIARALASEPEILLCDEATSALDPKTTLQILQLLKELNQKLGLTIVFITHEMQAVKEICNKVAVMENGRVVEQGLATQIFSRPTEALTLDFIRTATHIDQALAKILQQPDFSALQEDEWLVELTYVGEQTNEPLIAQLYRRYQVTTNILYGNIEILQDTPLGSLIVTLRGDLQQREKALTYLKKQAVTAKILKNGQEETLDSILEGEL